MKTTKNPIDSPLKIDATQIPTPTRPPTIRELPAGAHFRMSRTATHYVKTRDGSIRNLDKAVKREERRLKAELRRAGHSPEKINSLIAAATEIIEKNAGGQPNQ